MQKHTKYAVLILSFLSFIQLACIFSFSPETDDSLTKEQTSIAQTIEAIQQQEDQPQPETLKPVDTKAPDTPQPVQPPTQTPKPCNDAFFISETIPDDTEFDPNDSFTKSWRFKNIGTCTWNTNYKLVYKNGDQMGAPATKPLTGDVAPGETIDIAVNMTSPSSGGTYQSYWKLVDNNGVNMLNNHVWVKIKVKSAAFAVTSVTVSVAPPVFVGPCPFPFQFTANITANGAGTVSYYWERSDGGTFGNASLNFTSAGTKTVNTVWVQIIPSTHWMKIYIDNPNHQSFGNAAYTLTCIP